jgi:hypothetical protein
LPRHDRSRFPDHSLNDPIKPYPINTSKVGTTIAYCAMALSGDAPLPGVFLENENLIHERYSTGSVSDLNLDQKAC